MVRDLQEREEEPSSYYKFKFFLFVHKLLLKRENVKTFVLSGSSMANARSKIFRQQFFCSVFLKGRLPMQRLSTSHPWSTPARTSSARTWS
jgi:hypothetical protein